MAPDAIGSHIFTESTNTMKKITALSALALLAACVVAVPAWSAEIKEAPAFSVSTDTGELNLADFRGKTVYLDFWASWCGPCRASFKWLNEAHEKYASKGLVIIAINVDTDKALAARFLKENPVDFRIGYDPNGKVAETYQLKGMPSSYMIDRNGKLHVTHVGYRAKDKEALEEELQKLLADDGVVVGSAGH